MPLAVSNSVPAIKRQQTDALNRATAGVGQISNVPQQNAEAHNGL